MKISHKGNTRSGGKLFSEKLQTENLLCFAPLNDEKKLSIWAANTVHPPSCTNSRWIIWKYVHNTKWSFPFFFSTLDVHHVHSTPATRSFSTFNFLAQLHICRNEKWIHCFGYKKQLNCIKIFSLIIVFIWNLSRKMLGKWKNRQNVIITKTKPNQQRLFDSFSNLFVLFSYSPGGKRRKQIVLCSVEEEKRERKNYKSCTILEIIYLRKGKKSFFNTRT